jgi:hypothetical protein
VNHSIYSADRMTHLKIVVVAMIAGVALVSVGISVRLSSDDGDARTARVIKAGKGWRSRVRAQTSSANHLGSSCGSLSLLNAGNAPQRGLPV